MRQCREAIAYLSAKKNPIYEIEIKGEKEMLQHFMNEVLGRAA